MPYPPHRSMAPRCAATVALLYGLGCGAPVHQDRAAVEASIAERTGVAPSPSEDDTSEPWPAGIELADGLDADEAVAIAIWRNAEIHAALSDLGVSRARLLLAGTVPNPGLSVLFPFGPKQLEFAIKLPLEALVLRARRVEASRADAAETAARVIQQALDLVRDVRTAHAEAWAAGAAVAIAREALAAADGIASLEQRRATAGDASDTVVADAALARAQAIQAVDHAERTRLAAEARFALAIGLPGAHLPVNPPSDHPAKASGDVSSMVERAQAVRPDLRAIDHAIAAAITRADTSRLEILTATGIADANGNGSRGFEIGPGVDLPLPIFNWNAGGMALADAELARLLARRAVLRDAIIADVREAAAQLTRAAAHLAAIQREPDLANRAAERLRHAAERGDVSRLEAQRSHLALAAAQLRLVDARADYARAAAQLERALGGPPP